MTPTEKIRLELQQQINEHALPAYIYTYPPKGAYKCTDNDQYLPSVWREVTGDINLYIHIPFCFMKCSFCDLFTILVKNTELIDSYVDALINELKIVSSYMNLNALKLQSIYFGGGTPNLLTASQLERLLNEIKQTFSFSLSVDISIEGTPDSFTIKKLNELKSLGFTRISIGIESFHEKELIDMGRKYDSSLSHIALHEAMKCNYKNVNIDLIYGLPGQSVEDWTKNLEFAVEASPNTITVYPFVTRNRTHFGKQLKNNLREDCVPNKKCYDWYDYTKFFLEKMGYKQDTFVTFSKDNGGCIHEMNEFKGISTLSLGAGGRSYTPSLHYANDDYINRKPNKLIIQDYINKIQQLVLPIRSIVELTQEERKIRYVVLSLLSSGIDILNYKKMFHEPIEKEFSCLLTALELEQCVYTVDHKIKMTEKGLKYSSLIATYFFSQSVKDDCNKYY